MKNIIFMFLVLSTKIGFTQNKDWIKKDKDLIDKICGLNREKPKDVEEYFMHYKYNNKKENNGFGWSMLKLRIPAGYIYISATFIYFKDSIISYEIKPQLPLFVYGLFNNPKDEISKRKQIKYYNLYKSWYKPYFVCDSFDIQPFTYHFEEINKPLAEYNTSWEYPIGILNFIEFNSPYSNTLYSKYKRRDFEKLKEDLNIKQIELLMYSLNPATRLTAIEYYFKNKELFNNQDKINNWIEIVFNELPETKTVLGCIGLTINTKRLVKEIFGNE